MEMLKRFYSEEEGMGTVEIVMIIAALMCIALLFRKQVYQFANSIMKQVFDKNLVEKPGLS
ncbi:Flp1 family type IVb pilin [Ventrimonas sp. CLA-AP-H27]|uniref:Flp1 family type IVb pilin n=1 Tax=Ventrimonas faecis TaxID=3133170 RepID=A0ABV1HI33_9FIRM